ncbi:protein phosphatase 2C domain-containing protein [Kitasatospora purpeofusca]|uniref:protein phosphatase 2C domain-containing protein n=1 Tax=Kitasatospora purpeofusca TaxID=67352 RepID=UPI0030F0B9B0
MTTRKGESIDVTASVYVEPASPARAPAPAPSDPVAGPVVVSGRVTPEDCLRPSIGQGPSAARGPWPDPLSPVDGPVEPAAAGPVGDPATATPAVAAEAGTPTEAAPPTGADTPETPEAPDAQDTHGSAPVVRPPSFREPGPLSHVGRKPPAYPAEPTDIPAVRGTDLFGALLPDTVVDGGRFGQVDVRAASVRGDSHRYAAECRQDAALIVRADELLLVAVADGVGSQPHSHHGSNGIVRLLAKQVLPKADILLGLLRSGAAADFASLTSRLVAAAADELTREAERFGHPPKSWSTTLRALLVPIDPEIRTRGFVAVGDGGLLRLREDGWVDLDTDGEDAGTLISTRTDCLPEAYELARTMLITDTRPGDVLVLCTDGLALPLVKEPELRQFLGRRWVHEVPGLAEFLWQAQVRVRSYDDDRSVVCLWEAPA